MQTVDAILSIPKRFDIIVAGRIIIDDGRIRMSRILTICILRFALFPLLRVNVAGPRARGIRVPGY